MKMQQSRNVWLDLFRFILVFFVINIHYNNQSVMLPVFRMAVPMFFMISGYFAFSKDKTKQSEKNKRFINNALRYLIIGCITYFVFDLISIGIASSTGKLDTVIQSFILTGIGGGEEFLAVVLRISFVVFAVPCFCRYYP